MELYNHQKEGIEFLKARDSAMLLDEMGLGKTRQALLAAHQLFVHGDIQSVLVLCPAAVRYSWGEELIKLIAEGITFIVGGYSADKERLSQVPDLALPGGLPVAIVSYALLPQDRHVLALSRWCVNRKTLLICDESSFLKNREAKQTKGAWAIGLTCVRRWLLTGTPIANGPIDMWSQGFVMSGGAKGPLQGFKNYYHFKYKYATLGGYKNKQIVAYHDLENLQERFAPYVLRREKKDCLDLPPKVYEVRQVPLTTDTWKIYQELKRDALLVLPPDGHVKPEPHAAVRIMRLAQLTSGHVGGLVGEDIDSLNETQDISAEKLTWLTNDIITGELSSERALIVWVRWRRERERLAHALAQRHVAVPELHGGQSQERRDGAISFFQTTTERVVLLAQPHAGGFGLNLTQASVAIYLSNDFSYTTRVQSEDRCHRIGQTRSVTYIDVLATGPQGQKTIDWYTLDCLRKKKNIADLTCAAWRDILEFN